jgi:hypothetical protein
VKPRGHTGPDKPADAGTAPTPSHRRTLLILVIAVLTAFAASLQLNGR